jgi:predicted amidohydrolase YtcJ
MLGLAPIALAILACGPSRAVNPPDLILTDARIFTADPARPEAEALAVADRRIVAVGRAADLLPTAGPATKILRAGGRRVVPGFIDTHVHFIGGGRDLLGPDLRGIDTEAEFARRLAAAAARLPKGSWITGGGWDHERWPGAALPHRKNVDPLTPDHPLIVSRTDGHLAFANGLALTLSGVTRDTPDPAGGVIGRDPDTREPTGILKDAAIGLVEAKVPPPTFDERLAAAREALALARRHGVTAIHDMAGSADLDVYRRLERDGTLTVRVRLYFPMASRRRAFAEKAAGADLLRVMGTKAFADGSLGASTAFMFEPFDDDPKNAGLRDAAFQNRDAFLSALLDVDREGMQTCVHAIGDRANREVLDLFEEVARRNGPRDRRARVEHAQHLTPEDIPRFARLGVIPSMQPYHCVDDGRWAERRLGARRSRTTYPFRSLLDAGATLAFGSDWPVAPLEPALTLHAAVTRATLDGKHPGGWVPEERISPAEAIVCHTRNAAYAAFDETRLGRLAPGFLADFVVLSDDPLSIDPARLEQVQATLTVLDGRIIHGGL